MALSDSRDWGAVSRNFPQPFGDGLDESVRLWHDQSQAVTPVLSDMKPAADEGTYFVAMNTPGFITNAIAGNIQTSLTDTTPTLIIINNNVTSSGVPDRRIYLDQVKLMVGVVSASNTDLQYAWKLDTVPRYTSGGTNISPNTIAAVGGNPNLASGNVSKALIYAGVLTVAAASAAARVVDTGQLRPKNTAPVMVIGDEYTFKFGSVDPAPPLNAGTAVGTFLIPAPPIVLGPQHSAALYIWGTAMATTAPSWFPVVKWLER
jgi:hypothetical protein